MDPRKQAEIQADLTKSSQVSVGQALARCRGLMAGLDARLLLARATGLSQEYILAHPERMLDPEAARDFFAFAERRSQGEPVAYILGMREFYGLDFFVDRHTLIPRPDSELLVETAIALIGSKPMRLLDLCCGTGCLGISIKRNEPEVELFMCDISQEALEVARKNCARLIGGGAVLLSGDLYGALPDNAPFGIFGMIISNPPYISADEMEDLSLDVRHEPDLALFGGKDGLDVIRRVVAGAPDRLAAGGHLLMEVGSGQGKAARELCEETGCFGDVRVLEDLSGLDRAVVAKRLG